MKGLMSILFFILSACAAVETRPSPPAMDLRTYDLCPDVAGFCYQWEVCTKKGLGGRCREWSVTKEVYDLNDPEIRSKFYNMNIVGKVREKPIHP